MDISVIAGNIAQVRADGLSTAVNSAGMWFGGIDGVIQQAAGDLFHQQLSTSLRTSPNDEVVIATEGNIQHDGCFRNVVFVIDDLKEQLSVIVRRGLTVASASGMKSVTLPSIRPGVMSDVMGSPQEKLSDMAQAIANQAMDPQNFLENVTVVVYGDLSRSTQLRELLKIE